MIDLSRDWKNQGHVIVRGLYPKDLARRLLSVCNECLTQWRAYNPETGEPGGGPDATVMRHLNHPQYHRAQPAQLIELLEATATDAVLDISREILGDDPLFRCTSLFMNPLENSRDGNWHRDSQFHCPDEDDEKALIVSGGDSGTSLQLQIPLLDSDDVEVVPGSHLRWDTDAEYAIRRGDGQANNTSDAMPGAVRADLAAGDAVAFNPCAIHRGRYHHDQPRRTLMLTYTARSHPRFDYFSDQPWFDEFGYLDGCTPSTRHFFLDFMDHYGDNWRAKR
ncbi:MAG: phytanoyl-CoA dioxygenase family protein [Candidatus Latescibacterota bacterium]|nr:phytanoyl-CoA dioxygenase family protein [Candidatus Latescibacterota bacterium]